MKIFTSEELALIGKSLCNDLLDYKRALKQCNNPKSNASIHINQRIAELEKLLKKIGG